MYFRGRQPAPSNIAILNNFTIFCCPWLSFLSAQNPRHEIGRQFVKDEDRSCEDSIPWYESVCTGEVRGMNPFSQGVNKLSCLGFAFRRVLKEDFERDSEDKHPATPPEILSKS